MKKRGKSAAFMKALRRKYRLGEFAKPRSSRARRMRALRSRVPARTRKARARAASRRGSYADLGPEALGGLIGASKRDPWAEQASKKADFNFNRICGLRI